MNPAVTERKTIENEVVHAFSSHEMIISNEQIVTFPDGIPGFETVKNFILGEVHDYPPFMLLFAEEDRTVTLLLLSVKYVYSYNRKLKSLYEKYGGLYTNDQTGYFDTYLILQYNHDTKTITANLKAPIIVEKQKRIGKQLILDTDELPCRYPLSPKAG